MIIKCFISFNIEPTDVISPELLTSPHILHLITTTCDDDIPLIYIRANPHTYHVKDTLYDPQIEEVFKKLLQVIRQN